MHLHSTAVSCVCLLSFCLSAAAQVIPFSNRPAEPNDIAKQTIQCDLDAVRTIRQHNQIVDSSQQRLHRQQVRTVTVLETDQGTAARARITFAVSTTKLKAGKEGVIEAKQPVEGNTYVVSRQGEELIIAKENGEPITEEEDKLLRVQLSTFGKPNPLSRFLHGKHLKVGDSVDVPKAVAAELLGLTGNQGKTDGLALKLTGTKTIDHVDHAVFETLLRSHSDESSFTLLMKGELIIDPATCRTRMIRLHGPIAVSERRGPTQGRFTVSTNGSLRVAVSNEHSTNVPTTARRRLFPTR